MASLALVETERDILARIVSGGALQDVLEDLIRVIEQPSNGDMLASILFLSEDGKHLLHGAAPNLPQEYNAAIHGTAIGDGAGSCGTAAFTGKPVYVRDIAADPLWKDFRDLALKHGLKACWSTPIRGTDGRVIGTFANYYREPRAPTEHDIEMIAMIAQTAAIAVERHRIELERRRAEEHRLLLLRELNHRVKNVFALANSLVVMSARQTTSAEELSQSLQSRFCALSRAHELVQPGYREGFDGAQNEVPLRAIIADILSPYQISDMEKRVTMQGPDVSVAPDAVTSLALVLHELATNAAKYGALSAAGGSVEIVWSLDGKALVLDWRERGGPAVRAPSRTGFGTKLSQRSIEGQLGGTIAYDWAADGLRVSMSLPRSHAVNA